MPLSTEQERFLQTLLARQQPSENLIDVNIIDRQAEQVWGARDWLEHRHPSKPVAPLEPSPALDEIDHVAKAATVRKASKKSASSRRIQTLEESVFSAEIDELRGEISGLALRLGGNGTLAFEADESEPRATAPTRSKLATPVRPAFADGSRRMQSPGSQRVKGTSTAVRAAPAALTESALRASPIREARPATAAGDLSRHSRRSIDASHIPPMDTSQLSESRASAGPNLSAAARAARAERQLRKATSELRQAQFTNGELTRENARLSQHVTATGSVSEELSSLRREFATLSEAYRRSESVRTEQRNLIETLRGEIDDLRKQLRLPEGLRKPLAAKRVSTKSSRKGKSSLK